MSAFKAEKVAKARTNHRCEGCAGFVTIKAGDPYYRCTYWGDEGRWTYAMCAPCYEHTQVCKSCSDAWSDGEPQGIHECRAEMALAGGK